MRKKLFLSLLALICCESSFASRLTKAQLDLIDAKFVAEKQQSCELALNNKVSGVEWLMKELKDEGFADFYYEKSKPVKWRYEGLTFKVAGQTIEGVAFPSAPGTFGTINDKEIKFGNDATGKILTADLIDAGNVLQGESKIWLLEYNQKISNPMAMVFEAKAKKALGVVFYSRGRQPDTLPLNFVLPLPTIFISDTDAHQLKIKLQKEKLTAELSLLSEFPFTQTQESVFVRQDLSSIPVVVNSLTSQCASMAAVLGVLEWNKKSPTKFKRTAFLFSDEPEVFRRHHLEWFSNAIKVVSATTRPLPELIAETVQADQKASGKDDYTPFINKINNVTSALKGVIDGVLLKRFGENLTKARTLARAPQWVDGYRVAQFVDPTAELAQMAKDLKTLKVLHGLVQSSQWEKAKKTCRALTGFDLANQLSTPAFIEYQTQYRLMGSGVDPQILTLLEGGRQNLDLALVLIEKEIDGLAKKMADNFFKLHQDVESLTSRRLSSG